MKSLLILSFLLLGQFSYAENCPELLLRLSTPEANHAKILQFKRHWLTSSSHQIDQNRRFMRAVDRGENGIYFQLENAVLKELNDKVLRDKDLVTSLDNYLKADFLERVNDSEVLKETLSSFYVDFKSIRFHLSSNSAAVKRELNLIYQQAMENFSETVNQMGLAFYYRRSSSLSSNPYNWYLAGIGKSNDQANFASRIGRTLFHVRNKNHLIDFSTHIHLFNSKLNWVEALRKELFHEIPDIFSKSEVLKLEIVEILRKSKAPGLDEYVAQLHKRLMDRYQLNLGRDAIIKLRDYYSNADLFSPALLLEQRVIVDMTKSVAGNISVDIAGMGARNMVQLQVALKDYKGKSVQGMLNNIRSSEVLATEELEHLRKIIRDSLEKVELVRKGRFDDTIQATGDDLVFFPGNGEYLSRHKKLFLNKLASHDESSSFRVVFLSQNDLQGREILHLKRMDYITFGEDVEKALRLKLEEHIPFERLKKLGIAVDMMVGDEGQKIELYIINGSLSDKKVIREELLKVIEDQAELVAINFL